MGTGALEKTSVSEGLPAWLLGDLAGFVWLLDVELLGEGAADGGDLVSVNAGEVSDKKGEAASAALYGKASVWLVPACLAYLGVTGRGPLRTVLVFWRMISLDLGAPINISTLDFVGGGGGVGNKLLALVGHQGKISARTSSAGNMPSRPSH